METDSVSQVRASVQCSQATPDVSPVPTTPSPPHTVAKETVDGLNHKANREVKEMQEMESMLQTAANSQTDNRGASATQSSEISCASIPEPPPHSHSLPHDNSNLSQEASLMVDKGHTEQRMDVNTNSSDRLVRIQLGNGLII